MYIGDITESTVTEEVRKGLDYIRSSEIIGKNSTIFVKLNLTDVTHKPGITTTPAMAKAVLEALSPLVKKVYIGESDGGNCSYPAEKSLANHGIPDMAKSFPNVEAVNLSRLPRSKVEADVCGRKVWVELPDLLLNGIDCLVSVPVFKTHAMTYGTYSIKNLWGCYPDPMRLLHHQNLDNKLALISKAAKNRIQIVDGFWALDGHGPMEGTPRRINKLLVGNDPVATDTTAAFMMGLSLDRITHIGLAEQYGLGTTNMDRIVYNKDVKREKLEAFKPYKIKMDYLNGICFKNDLMARMVMDSPLTPTIYTLVNMTRPPEKHTHWSSRNRQKWE